jgi:hypothetical protein
VPAIGVLTAAVPAGVDTDVAAVAVTDVAVPDVAERVGVTVPAGAVAEATAAVVAVCVTWTLPVGVTVTRMAPSGVAVPGVMLAADAIVASATGEPPTAAGELLIPGTPGNPGSVLTGVGLNVTADDPATGWPPAGCPPPFRADGTSGSLLGAPADPAIWVGVAGANAAGGFGITCPTVVPVEVSSETIDANGSPRATSTAVTPPIASPNPITATRATVITARCEIIPKTCWAASGDERIVFIMPSRRSARAETPDCNNRCSSEVNGARTISLTDEPMVAPIIAPASVPCAPSQDVKIAPQTAARPAVTMPATYERGSGAAVGGVSTVAGA